MNRAHKNQVLVVGSGAGGAVTSLELARQGFEVLVLEEGSRHTIEDYGARAPEAMTRLYRHSGMTPIMGSVPLGYVEGCCIGGSTEINSGFWHRTPPEALERWREEFDLAEAHPEDLEPHFEWAEDLVRVGTSTLPWPMSTKVLARGAEAMHWAHLEVPRAAENCRHTNACAHGCPTGAKQGMSVSLIPKAEEAGVQIIPRCRVKLVLKDRGKVRGVLATLATEEGTEEIIRIEAEHIILCAGPTETPALLRRSGIKFHIGDSLHIHPMLKVAALYPETIDAQDSVLPLVQVKEFAHDISLGGAFYTPGHLAITLTENWPENRKLMRDYRKMATFYVAARGTGRGTIRTALSSDNDTLIRYALSNDDIANLSRGLARLATLLLAGGAKAVYPCVHGIPPIRSEAEAKRWLEEPISKSALSLTTVHAFSACPIGGRMEKCAADSFGKIHGFENLYVNDASMIPDAPGVNPQGTVMALARRNAIHFAESTRP